MQKNPFLPPPSYNPQQPPLPPGPPPQRPPQTDYSSYWSSAASHNHGQQPSSGTYNSQWNPPQPAQPPRPPAEQSALYANYGYGGNQSYWQQQQHQRQQQSYQSPHPPPVPQPPAHPPAQQYSQYQPPTPYQPQPYVPHVPGPPPVQQYQPQPQPLQAQPTPPYFPQQSRPHQNQPPRQGSQQFQQPPAKRARFDGGSRSFQQPQFPPPPNPMPLLQAQPTLPNYIPPPPPIQQPLNPQNRGGMRDNRARINKSGSTNMNRNRPPGQQNNRGNFPNNQNRRNLGGSQGGSFRNQQRQGNLGSRDHNNNRSFNAGQQQQSRGRNNQRSGRNDGSFVAHGSGTSARKEEIKRAMTDFKLVAIEIKQLGWSWGVVPPSQGVDLPVDPNRESPSSVKTEANEKAPSEKDPAQPSSEMAQGDSNVDLKAEPSELDSLPAKPDLGLPPVPHTGDAPPIPSPPSRVRIYFHTPVTPKDSMPIPHASAIPVDPSALASQGSPRKGKRKRTDDEEDDDAESRTLHASAAHQDDAVSVTAHPDGFRDSVAPSVGESTSEGDWLMAAIKEDGDEGSGPDVSHRPPHDGRMVNGVDDDEADDGEVERAIVGPPKECVRSGDVEAPSRIHANGLVPDYVPPPSDDPPGLPTGDPSITDDISGAPDEQPTQQEPAVETDGEDEDESPDFVAFPDDQSSIRDEDHRSASPEPHAAFDYGAFPNGRLGPAGSFSSTIAENESQEVSFSEYGSTLVNEDAVMSTEPKGAQTTGNPARDSLSPTSTLLTTGQEACDSALQAVEARTLSANRLAISYASASRRILIDAKTVDTLRVFRKEHRIEIDFNVEKGDDTEIKGVMVEILSEAAKKYTPLQLASEAYESDPMFPPLLTAKLPSKLNLVIHLDAERPIPEAKWVKTGDVHEWVRSTFGRIFSDVSEGWEKKIAVQDPDPAPTIRSILDGWALNGNVGSQTERQRFVKTHLSEMDNVLEILLRLIRGERATAFPQSNATVAATRNGVPGPLLAAIEGHAHGAQQTHVSLAVLAMFRMLVEFAKRADGEKGKGEVEERVGEIIRCLPVQLLHKSVEGMFKEWKVEKKGGNPLPR